MNDLPSRKNEKDGLTNGLVLPSQEVIKKNFTEMIQAKFPSYDASITKVRTTDVKSVEEMSIAEGVLKSATKLLKEIDAYRLENSKPFTEIATAIKSASDALFVGPMDEAIKGLKENMKKFKIAQEKVADDQRKKAEAEAEKKRLEMEKEVNLMEVRFNMASCKIFGGSYTLSNGEIMTCRMISNEDEAQKIKRLFSEKFPFNNVSDEMQSILKAVRDESIKSINQLIKIFRDGDMVVDRVADVKVVFDEMLNVYRERVGIKIEKMVKKEVSRANAFHKSVKKGLTKEISFLVTDLSKVPIEYLMINESAVREFYTGEKREMVLDSIEKGRGGELISGIAFSAETKVVVR